jgi:hypothetical protein
VVKGIRGDSSPERKHVPYDDWVRSSRFERLAHFMDIWSRQYPRFTASFRIRNSGNWEIQLRPCGGHIILLNFRKRMTFSQTCLYYTRTTDKRQLLTAIVTSVYTGRQRPAAKTTRRDHTRGPHKMSISTRQQRIHIIIIAPFGDAYEKIGTIQRRLAWPLHKDDTLSRSGRSTDLNIYFVLICNRSLLCCNYMLPL